MLEHPRDMVNSNDVPAIGEYSALSEKLKARKKITPVDVDEALNDYRGQLNTKWLPVLNDLRSSASADYAAEFKTMKQEIVDLRKTVNDFKELLALLTKAAP